MNSQVLAGGSSTYGLVDRQRLVYVLAREVVKTVLGTCNEFGVGL